jgi:hypothetical protein
LLEVITDRQSRLPGADDDRIDLLRLTFASHGLLRDWDVLTSHGQT